MSDFTDQLIANAQCIDKCIPNGMKTAVLVGIMNGGGPTPPPTLDAPTIVIEVTGTITATNIDFPAHPVDPPEGANWFGYKGNSGIGNPDSNPGEWVINDHPGSFNGQTGTYTNELTVGQYTAIKFISGGVSSPWGKAQMTGSNLLVGLQVVYPFNDQFDGDNKVYDALTGLALEINGIGVTDPVIQPGLFADSIWFDGTSDPPSGVTAAPDDSKYHLETDKTVSFWLYPGDNAQTAVVMGCGSYSDLLMEWMVVLYTSNEPIDLYFIMGNGTINQQLFTLPALSQWYHVLFTFDATTKTMKCYVDGVLTNTIVSPFFVTKPNAFSVGTDALNTFIATDIYSVDELNIWGRKLTDPEIAQLYNGGDGLPYPFV